MVPDVGDVVRTTGGVKQWRLWAAYTGSSSRDFLRWL